MKRMLCILVATMILALFMTGCGDRGKIGNGENGTYSDNTTQSTEKSTANGGNTTDNNSNGNANNGGTDNDSTNGSNNNDSGIFDNNNDGTEQNTDNSNQEGIAGRVGDAIDEGVSGITDGLMGNDNNNNNNDDTNTRSTDNNNTQPMQ